MKSKKEQVFKVKMILPEGATIPQARDYIKEAVMTWCGQLNPGTLDMKLEDADPLFYLKTESIRVSHVRKAKEKL